MIVHYIAAVALVAVALPASCVAHNTMTKNLKVLVSSNDFPTSGLKVLEEQWVFVIILYYNHVILTVTLISYVLSACFVLNEEISVKWHNASVPSCTLLVKSLSITTIISVVYRAI